MNTPRKATAWYRDALEHMVRGRTEVIKMLMLEIFDKEKMIPSYRAMNKMLGGRAQYNSLAWNELLRSGEIVKCVVGYSRPGTQKHINNLVAEGRHLAKLSNGVGEEIRRKYIADAKTMITLLEARALVPKAQEEKK